MEEQAKNKKKKFILIGLGMAATGVLGFFGWQYWKNRKKKKEEESETDNFQLPPPKNIFIPNNSQQSRNDDFPLKKGSKGTKVKALQDALIAKYGSGILPRYGADGDFGSETVAALKKSNFPEVIDESTFNVIAQSSFVDAGELAKSLYKNAVNKNLSGIIASLKKMKSKSDYSSVSKEFKKLTLRGVSQTLVNGLLGSFSNENQKQQIRLEFSRMGLKYDGNKWSLSGLDGFTIITIEPAMVWKSPHQAVRVLAKMVLGTKIAQRGDYTLFENNEEKFLVKTSSVKYL